MPKHAREPGLNDQPAIDEGSTSSLASAKGKGRATNAKAVKGLKELQRGKKGNPLSTGMAKGDSELKAEKPTRRARLIVAFDYGTTHSGIAYVHFGNSDVREVQVIDDWGSGPRQNEKLEKTPSRIAYPEENDGHENILFGYNVPPDVKSYTWVKLRLDDHATESPFDIPHLKSKAAHGMLELPPGKTSKQVTSDIYKCLMEHAMYTLRREYTEDLLDVTPIDFWLTHPASWDDASVSSTRQAALLAGIGPSHKRPKDRLSMITEPEAAAISILSDSIDKDQGLYKVGTNMLVADLGGGTLDFQCLKIQSLEPLKTEEACSGRGKSGASYIDFELFRYLEGSFGEAFTKLPATKIGQGSEMMTQFESIKKGFTGQDLKNPFRLSLPALGKRLDSSKVEKSKYDFDDGQVLLSSARLMEMFEPVIKKAFALVLDQLDQLERKNEQAFKIIALCGGLGSSSYVFDRFEQFCNNDMKGAVKVVTDRRAWSAVARGAAIRGLEGSMIVSRAARRAYGLCLHVKFDPKIHKEEHRYDCPTREKRAIGYIDWKVKKNMRLEPNTKKTWNVYLPIADNEGNLVYTWSLYASYAEPPPARVDDPGVEKIGQIRVDLRDYAKRLAKRQKLTPTKNNNKEVDINLNMTLASERGYLEFKAFHEKVKVGSTKIEYGNDKATPRARRLPGAR